MFCSFQSPLKEGDLQVLFQSDVEVESLVPSADSALFATAIQDPWQID